MNEKENKTHHRVTRDALYRRAVYSTAALEWVALDWTPLDCALLFPGLTELEDRPTLEAVLRSTSFAVETIPE